MKTKKEMVDFISSIARMKQDGEEQEGKPDYIMENDDAVITLNELIDTARELLA